MERKSIELPRASNDAGHRRRFNKLLMKAKAQSGTIRAASSSASGDQHKCFVEAAGGLGGDEEEAAFGRKLKKVVMAGRPVVHKSDCAVHDAPAYEAGPCTCGAEKKAKARR